MKRALLAIVAAAVAGCGLATGSPAFGNEYRIAPAPEWVRPLPVELAPERSPEQVTQGSDYLLSDVQVRIEPQDRVSYQHVAVKAINATGVEAIAQIQVRFDPSFQTLTLHAINIRRNGRTIAKLATAAVRVLQREKELDYLIYDGSKTANVFLEDVRVGDIVEYAYSLRGSNPVFGNRVSGQFDLQWSVPVRQLYRRLLLPRQREISFVNHNTTLRPVVREQDGYRDYSWEAKDLPALHVESDAPDWFNPYGSVQWSEFKDWESVARWAEPLYRVPDQLSPALRAEVTRISFVSSAPGEQLLEVLRFVQREIRYLGIEIGAGSHAPNPPEVVVERRFGDCKDKTLLMVTMLQALGIEAQPALVNTSLRKRVSELQPTPIDFNHVLVRARLAGRDYWIDPTRSPQKGDLANLYQPDYGYALIVDGQTRALSPMTAAATGIYRRTINTVLDASAGFDQPVRFSVKTIFEGASAESMRATLASENHEDLQKKYVNFYASYYPDVSVAAPFDVVDDDTGNRLTVNEQYTISNFWRRVEAKKRSEAQIYAPDVAECLQAPRNPIRFAPLRVVHPVDLTHMIEVRLPEKWTVEPEQTTVQNPAFEFERRVAGKGKLVTLNDHFRSRADYVAAADTPRYAADLERARDAIGYYLYMGDEAPSRARGMDRINWSVATIGVLLLLLWIWLALKLYRFDLPPRAPSGPLDRTLFGIGGWLVLPAIGIALTPIRTIAGIIELLPAYENDNWAALTTVGTSAYHALWAPTLLFELATNLAQAVFAVLLLVLFFRRRSTAPYVFIGLWSAVAVAHSVDLALCHVIPAAASKVSAEDWREFARDFVVVLVWTPYFLLSRRVKATFVRTRDNPRPAQVVAQPTPETGAPQS